MKKYRKSEVVEALLREASNIEGKLEAFLEARVELAAAYDADGEQMELTDEAIEKEERWITCLREVAFNIQYGKILE